jgi:hypothetical protein
VCSSDLTQDPSSGSVKQYLTKVTEMVQLCRLSCVWSVFVCILYTAPGGAGAVYTHTHTTG